MRFSAVTTYGEIGKRSIADQCGCGSSGIIAPKKAREVSGRAKRRTPGGSLESSRLAARCLNSRAFALLLTRRDGAQRPRRDRHHRALLLFGRQVLYELLVSLL